MASDTDPPTVHGTIAGITVVEGQGRVIIQNPLPSDHTFYAKVGHVASEWAHLEHILDLVIWELAGVDPQKAACITAQIMGVGGRCKTIGSLGGLVGLSAPLLKRVRVLMSDSYPVGDLRARVVHDPWYIEVGRESVGQFKSMAYSDQRYGIKDVDDAEIAETLNRIQKLKDDAGAIRNAILSELDTLRKKHRPSPPEAAPE